MTYRPADKALSWWSILGIGLLVVVFHQFILVPLSIYSIARGKTLPENVLVYVFYILCWPFALVSRLGFTKNSVLIVSWFLGSLFWALSAVSMRCITGSVFMVVASESSNQSMKPTAP